MARQHLSLTVFYGHVLANSLRGNKVPGGPQMSSHVTFLALPQGRPVPLEVMFLLRKSLCHTWDRKKNIYFESQSNHSELAQPFKNCLDSRERLALREKTEVYVVKRGITNCWGRRAGFIILILGVNSSGQPYMTGASLYTPSTPWCRDLGTHPANREVTYSYNGTVGICRIRSVSQRPKC